KAGRMIRVEIVSDTRYPVNRRIVRKAVVDCLTRNKIAGGDVEVSVAVVGRRKMKILSDKFLKDGKNHEILSFPYEDISNLHSEGFINPPDGVLRLGDIVLCWPEVILAASADDVMVDDELYSLTEHGVDHLLGKHHE
ncbi:MAG: hypothetical protein UU23_C0007G0001, partial [Candidatus Curtissbacteria bacterium GW2011_GWA1_40_9]